MHLCSGGYSPKTFLLNILLNMFVRFGLHGEADELFDKMPERNVVSWTTLIAVYANTERSDRALELMTLMLREGVEPNGHTYSAVLKACGCLSKLRELHCSILKVGLECDVFVRSALIDNYSKLGEMNDALGVFSEMTTGDLIVWNSIIGGFAQNNDANAALNLYKSLKRFDFKVNQATLTSVLRACTSLTLLELGRQVHVHILKYDQDLILNNALLDMYCKSGGLEDANLVFSRMAEKDVISWSTMIAGLAQNGFSHEALNLFDQMQASGTKPNYISIVGVLFACSHAGLMKEGMHYFRSMKKLFGVEPGREHYSCIIDLLGRAGKLHEAVKMIEEMKCELDAVTWRTLLSACRVHRNTDLAIHAAKQILRLDPEDAGTYTILSNIYASTQRWEDVTEVRKSMRIGGISKEPGCSWIEVNKKIHAFIVDDNSHPEKDVINRQVNLLSLRLRELGYLPDTNFVLQDLEGEQSEDSLRYHSEKLAMAYGLMNLPREKTLMVRKNLRICVDCHFFAKLLSKLERRKIVIRDPIRYHHFSDGICSCGDYW